MARRRIYLDHAGATPLDPKVERVILANLKYFGNASSVHQTGSLAGKIVSNSRKKIATVLGSRPEEIIFTGSGTESANLAIMGVARAYKRLGRHIITTNIEHQCVEKACEYLVKNEGFELTVIDVNDRGLIDPAQVTKAIRSDTVLVSIIYANNEIGTIQPIAKIARTIREHKNLGTKMFDLPLFHIDACQAAGTLKLNVQELGVDLLTLNGSKIYGPKGIGCLFGRHGVRLEPLILGGGQERGLRAGTENPALIAGFAEALVIANRDRKKESLKLSKLRDYLIKGILKNISEARLNGDTFLRLPNNINMSFENVDGEMLMLALDQKGIEVSTGSACTVAETGPSHVMKAIGNPDNWGNIRITLGKQTTKKNLDYVLRQLITVVTKLRSR